MFSYYRNMIDSLVKNTCYDDSPNKSLAYNIFSFYTNYILFENLKSITKSIVLQRIIIYSLVASLASSHTSSLWLFVV